MNTDAPIAMAWGWSTDLNSRFSTAIRYFSRPGWAPRPLAEVSHMFTVYLFQDAKRNCIHEALLSEGWTTKPLPKLYQWHVKDPQHHPFYLNWLDIPPDVIGGIYEESCGWLGTMSYASQQLGYIALSSSLAGRAMRCLFPSALGGDVAEDRVVCHEGAHRLVGTHWSALDLRVCGETWAAGSPAEIRRRYLARLNAFRTAERN